MKISELMELEIFKTSKLLTGEIGLDNEVESAMVLEALDIERWSKKNQIILTSFYAFSDLSEKELELFFDKMSHIGISALIVKVDRLISKIPTWLIELCFRFKIPLIKVAQDISYEKIILATYEPILNYQTHLLRTYYDVRQRFTKLERNISSFEQIMYEFYELINKSCTLSIPDNDIALSFGDIKNNLVVTSRKPMKRSEFTKNHYQLLALFSQDNSHEYSAVSVEITNAFVDECTLLIYQNSTEFKETDLMIIENVIDIIQEKLQMEYLLKKDRYTRMNNLADAILQNTPNNMDELNSLLKEAKLNSHPFYQAVIFSAKESNSKINNKKIINILRSLKKDVIFFEHHDYIIFLYNFENKSKTLSKNNLKIYFDDFVESGNYFTLAVSSIKEKDGLKDILVECLDMLKFNRQFYIDYVLNLDDLGIFRYFTRKNDLSELENLIPERLIYLAKNNFDLFDTLANFLENNKSYKDTSEMMFLHSKTIRYRINKVVSILEVDFDNPIQVLNYTIGTYLLKLKLRGLNND